jgi:signal transduction histidine kinase/ligand-binding sensor domain-containing protein
MKAFTSFLAVTILPLLCCNSKNENNDFDDAINKTHIPTFQLTKLADLPDSMQPRIVHLDSVEAPVITPAQKNTGTIKTLAILQNPFGEPGMIAAGKTAITGDAMASNFTTFTSGNGLASDGINCSLMDRFGNIWFGTNGGGVSRYDGKSFNSLTTIQGLGHNNVMCIAEDRMGNLWFGTAGGGVSRYDGKSFCTITTAQGLANNNVWSIVEDKIGNLWFGTSKGVCRYDGISLSTFIDEQWYGDNHVTSIIEDKTGNLWFGTYEGGLSRFDGKSYKTYTTSNGLPTNIITCSLLDKFGNLWFGTHGGGVLSFDGKSFITYTTVQGLASNDITSITKDKSGNLWFGSFAGGVTRFDGRSFRVFTKAQGLASNDVSSITEDKIGNLWFCTLNEGVSRFDRYANRTFTSFQVNKDYAVMSIAEDKMGNLWFGTYGGGVSRYDGKSFSNISISKGGASNGVVSITEDEKGNLWFGSFGGGVTQYDGKSFKTFTTAQGLASNDVKSIVEDKEGNLWLGTFGGGVSSFNGKSFTTYTTSEGLAHNRVTSIVKDKTGSLWFGTYGGGVSRYDGKTFRTFTTAQGLAHNLVRNMMVDSSGNLWFGTQEGLSLMRSHEVRMLAENAALSGIQGEYKSGSSKSISSLLFRNFNIKDGLPDNVVSHIVQMPDGKMAIGTNMGISIFAVTEEVSKLTDIELYSSNSGFPINTARTGLQAMFLDSKGVIWVSTGIEKTALVRFDYSALGKSVASPKLVIQSVKINDEPVSWYSLQAKRAGANHENSSIALIQEFLAYGKSLSGTKNDSIINHYGNIQFDSIGKFYSTPHNLVLPFEHNKISFEFVGIETDRPSMVNYQYILEGYDKNWSPVTNRSHATFGNIFEGTYTFKVKAQGANRIWTEPLTFTFKVLPPWYRSWWAYTLYTLLFLGTLSIYIKWREQRLRSEKKRLQDKVEERTNELKKSLAELKSAQSQLIQSEKMSSLGELTAGIAHEIQNPLNFVNNFSEVNNELIEEMKEEIERGGQKEALSIAENIKQNLDKIQHHSKRADAIVKGMLQHSQKGSGVKEPTNINALADEYLRLAYHGLKAKDKSFNATIKTEFDERIGNINVARQDIGRVLLNLINNAFYAVNEKAGSKDPGYQPTVEVKTALTGDNVIITVTDNGNGIPETIRNKIFQPFFTTKPTGEGTGLGLSLSYDIVKAHGGEIKVDSEEGKGSVFSIQLPMQT